MTAVTPPPFESCSAALRREVRYLLFDVDDTLTWRGRLPEPAANALYRAAEADLALIAVTGRSASWAELLLRMFPLEAAIAETGALCLVAKDGGRVELIHSEPDDEKRAADHARRRRAEARVLAEVPGARLALDNMGRLYDSAFDLVEDGPTIGADDAAQIRALLEEDGLTTAQSSVHVNAWFGAFDKATMVERYLAEARNTSLAKEGERLLYVGDSKNDGAMFARAGLSVGVDNVKPHLDWLAGRGEAPRYLVEEPGGLGFARLVRLLLEVR